MFDFGLILDFLKVEPGHGAVQCLLLFMIWWTSKGIRRDLADYKQYTDTRLDSHEKRLDDHEGRLIKLEK